MGLLIRLAIIVGIIIGGYTYISNKVIDEKLPELQGKVETYLNPEEKRAELLNNLEIKLDDIKKTYENIQKIDLDSIDDPEIKEIVKGIQDNLTEDEFEEIVKLVNNIKDLNNNGGIANETVGKIIDKIIPNSSTPTPGPSPSPSTQQCSWVCE